ncbi:TRAP transporter small permease [Roseibium sp. MMSF_3412]|uniref:TRAP transporter small permease n=1 Tax=Roseibium sp. MMSF_3412 TaxID=3046712 RepID=UPI00273E5D45|nr:TRAP transporter small permease [Roseibium sp. MMSF_3412]
MTSPLPEDTSARSTDWRKRVEVPFVIAGAVLVFVLMGLSVADAFLRSVINSPIFGANDYAQIILSFIVAVSFPLCVLSGRLIAIDTLLRYFPGKLQVFLDWASSLLGVVMLAYLAWRAFFNALEAASFGETTLLLQLPYAPSYYAVALGCGLSAMVLLLERLAK